MAAAARADQETRKVQVDRKQLIVTLESNLKKHVQNYSEAMAGYRSQLLAKINQAFDTAEQQLKAQRQKLTEKVSSFTEEDIKKQKDYMTLVDSITVEMKVPKLYANEYEAAIAMAKWDVRDTLELTHAEFTCFVRDIWDWTSDFEAVTAIYKLR